MKLYVFLAHPDKDSFNGHLAMPTVQAHEQKDMK